MLRTLRIGLIKRVIDINEHLFFERRLRKFYSSLPKGSVKTIVDVGANKGQSIDFFKTIDDSCTIHSFEPNKKLFRLLTDKYKAQKTIKLYNIGVSDKIGSANFHENMLDYTSTFEAVNPNSVYLDRKAKILGTNRQNIVVDTYSVETTTLSHFINTHINTPIDVLKLDVEGHEYSCLMGLFNEKLSVAIKYIQLEKHNDDMYTTKTSFDDITKLLNENGFSLKHVVRHGFSNLEEVIFSS